ncbi:MAG: glucose-1-phosphate adenylyltransferase subunit GlgD [Clostridiales bacterium]|nr:glucose-1-phosphate adenylyltransferase subunit GlgD [Clostridiales bacterium]
MKALGIIFSNIHDNTLPELVRKRTVASIPFGGRYRLIDFTLSNMVNSGIDTVGVITKRNYQSLMDHVGSGKDWDLARKNGGLIMLPPFGVVGDIDSLYSSRLEALKSITNFISRADEEYVVMTDCNIVFRMSFDEVIEEHIKNNADITLVYTKHKKENRPETSATVLTVDEDNKVNGIKYEEELNEDGNLFMNVYVMKRSLLQSIILDSISHNKRHFTTDILASAIGNMRIYGYEHKGYYAAISSLQAYYEHSLELLDEKNRHDIFGDRSIFTKIRDSAPTKYGATAVVKNSLIADGCVIEGEVENSILFRGVKIARGTKVKNCVLMQDTVTGENVSLNCIITDKNVVIRDRRILSGSENHPFYIGKGSMI